MAKASRGTAAPPPILLREAQGRGQPALEQGCEVGTSVQAFHRYHHRYVWLDFESLLCKLAVDCVWGNLCSRGEVDCPLILFPVV